MLNQHNIFLGSLAYSLGDQCRIDSAALPYPARVDMLINNGLKYYRKSSLGPEQLAAQAIENCLQASQFTPHSIDMLIYATTMTSVHLNGKFKYDALDHCLASLKLVNAYPVGLFLSHCANFVSALRMASNTLISEGIDAILLVLTDSVPQDVDRFMRDDISLLSDGAVACIVSRAAQELRLVHLTQTVDYTIKDDANPIVSMMQHSNAMQSILSKHFEDTGMCIDDYKYVITNNYNMPTLNFFEQHFLDHTNRTLLLTDNLAQNAHLFTADVLVNVKDVLDGYTLEHNDKLLLYSSGGNRRGLVSLEYLGNPP